MQLKSIYGPFIVMFGTVFILCMRLFLCVEDGKAAALDGCIQGSYFPKVVFVLPVNFLLHGGSTKH
jgi:hypothetical protein